MILITNDDGYKSPLLLTLYNIAKRIDDEVIVIAPEQNESGIGNRINLGEINLKKLRNNYNGYALNNTPVACVHYALQHYPPDLILSGINNRFNLGVESLLCSGTFMAARAGAKKGVRSLAISTNTITSNESFYEKIINKSLNEDFKLANLNMVNENIELTSPDEEVDNVYILNNEFELKNHDPYKEGSDKYSVFVKGNSSLSIII